MTDRSITPVATQDGAKTGHWTCPHCLSLIAAPAPATLVCESCGSTVRCTIEDEAIFRADVVEEGPRGFEPEAS